MLVCEFAFLEVVNASELSARHLPAAGRSRLLDGGPEVVHASEFHARHPQQLAGICYQMATCAVQRLSTTASFLRAIPKEPAGTGCQMAARAIWEIAP